MIVIGMGSRDIGRIPTRMVATMLIGQILVMETRIIVQIFKELFKTHNGQILIGIRIEITKNALGGTKIHTQGCMMISLLILLQLLTVWIRWSLLSHQG